MKLHLGCGTKVLEGFKHADLADLPHIDFRTDIASLPTIESGTVDLIYSSHAFGYFERQEAIDVLREWWRVLKVGGTLRLSVPDFAALVEVYQRTSNLALILGPLYGIINVGGKVLQERTIYDFMSLSTLLHATGFHRIRRWDWREVLPEDYDDCSKAYFPHMDFENGIQISLNVEADKSSWVY